MFEFDASFGNVVTPVALPVESEGFGLSANSLRGSRQTCHPKGQHE